MKKSIMIAVIYLVFVGLGLPEGVHGIAWPGIRADMDLPLEHLGIITSLLLILSAVSSSLGGRFVVRYGSAKVALASRILAVVGLFGFALSANFFWLILFAVVLGLSQGSVDTAINLYAMKNLSSRHMNWLHCFWGVGAMVGTVVMTAVISRTTWSIGYGILGVLQIALVLLILFSLLGGIWKDDGAAAKEDTPTAVKVLGLTQKRYQALALLAFFLYLGVEYTVGYWITSVMMYSRGLEVAAAGAFTFYYYGGIMAGRFASGMAASKLSNTALLRIGGITAVAGVVAMAFSDSPAGVLFIGLGLAPLFPCLMHETSRRFTKEVSDRLVGYQIACGCIGAVIISAGMGLLLSHVSPEMLFPVMGVCIALIFVINEVFNYSAPSSPRNKKTAT